MDERETIARTRKRAEFISLVAAASVVSVGTATALAAAAHMGLAGALFTPFWMFCAAPFWPSAVLASAIWVGSLKAMRRNQEDAPIAVWKIWICSLILAVTVGFVFAALPVAICDDEMANIESLGLLGSAGGLAAALLLTKLTYRKW